MKRFVSFLLLLSCLTAWANDGVYYTSGSFLIPVQETDISVSREVLTITIGKGGYAEVDVQYEFDNPKAAKTVLMAFEAKAPYNAQSTFNRKGIHPFIKDFTVTMNGKALPHRNAVVAMRINNETGNYETDFKPFDLNEWVGFGEVSSVEGIIYDDVIYHKNIPDSMISFAYAYFFDANFRQGRNTVHHTYKYKMSEQVFEDFRVPYWLTPASRWANRQIDDFTLRIIDQCGKGICMQDSLFLSAPFKAIKGECWQLDHVASGWQDEPEKRSVLFASQYSVVEWHGRNFRPTDNIEIVSAYTNWVGTSQSARRNSQLVVVDGQGSEMRYIGTCGNQYLVEVQDYGLVPRAGHKLELYSVEDGKGWLIIAPEYTGVNIRERPNAKSPIVTTIHSEEGELPEAYRCLGLIKDDDPEQWKMWYYIQVGEKKGYVNANLMLWDAINTY